MDTKMIIYLSIIFASFFIGSLIPINMVLGAPLSIVALAYFQPYLKRGITILVFSILTVAAIVTSYSVLVALFTVANNIYSALGIPFWCTCIVMIGGTIGARLLIMNTANRVIRKSKIRTRYPLCS